MNTVIKRYVMTAMWVFGLMCSCAVKLHMVEAVQADTAQHKPKLVTVTRDSSKRIAAAAQRELMRKTDRAFTQIDHLNSRMDEVFDVQKMQASSLNLLSTQLADARKIGKSKSKGKDSLYTLLFTLRDTVINANKRADVYYAKAQKAVFYQEQIKKADTFYNWSFWLAAGAFAIFFLASFGLQISNYRNIRKYHTV